MPTRAIEFQFLTGLKRQIFRNPRLLGSWDTSGRYSDHWSESPMQEMTGDDGCPMFQGSVSLDLVDSAKTFKWGVILDGPSGANVWGIPTEVQDVNSTERHREFQLAPGSDTQKERYFFTHCRRLGANKRFTTPGGTPNLTFAAWAPYAGAVDVVGFDPTSDVALVRTRTPLEGHTFTFSTKPPTVGSSVGVIGFPEGGPVSGDGNGPLDLRLAVNDCLLCGGDGRLHSLPLLLLAVTQLTRLHLPRPGAGLPVQRLLQTTWSPPPWRARRPIATLSWSAILLEIC